MSVPMRNRGPVSTFLPARHGKRFFGLQQKRACVLHMQLVRGLYVLQEQPHSGREVCAWDASKVQSLSCRKPEGAPASVSADAQ